MMTYLLETEDGEWGGEHARQEKSLRKKIYGKFPPFYMLNEIFILIPIAT